VRAAKALPADRQFKVLDSLGCRYLLSDSPMFDAASARRLLVEGFPFFIERISDKPASPYAVFTAMTAREAKDKLELFASPGFDPRETVLTEADVLKPRPMESSHPWGSGS